MAPIRKQAAFRRVCALPRAARLAPAPQGQRQRFFCASALLPLLRRARDAELASRLPPPFYTPVRRMIAEADAQHFDTPPPPAGAVR